MDAVAAGTKRQKLTYRGERARLTETRANCETLQQKQEAGDLSVLQMYDYAPQGSIALSKFEEIALERQDILKCVESVSDQHPRYTPAWQDALCAELRNKHYSWLLGKVDAQRRERDSIGHHILRLAYCRTAEHRKWLMQQETDLLRCQIAASTQQAIEQFVATIKLHAVAVEIDDNDEELKRDLRAALDPLSADALEHATIWRMDWTLAQDLIRMRKVVLRRGSAYTSTDWLGTVIGAKFRDHCLNAMMRAYTQLGVLEEDGRLLPRLELLAQNAYGGKAYGEGAAATGVLDRSQLDALAKRSFPLCMRVQHEHLRADHHLRHGARRQYGLFLKAAGLPMDDALALFRSEFTKRMDGDKFDKQYAYNVRHMYGKEGKRIEGRAQPCSTIILHSAPGPLDCHGCPYRHMDERLLAQRLTGTGLNAEQVRAVLELSRSSAYDKACTRQFEWSHGFEEGRLDQLISHPNQYFDLAEQLWRQANVSSTTSTQQQSAPGGGGSQEAAAATPDLEDFK